MIHQLIQSIRQRLDATTRRIGTHGGTQSTTLILFYNTMWDQLLELPDEPLPTGCTMTTDKERFDEAAAVVFHIPSLHAWPTQAKRPGQLWVAWSMESDVNYPQLRSRAYMRPFDLTMTYRLDSDVSMPYVWYYSNATNLARTLREPPQPKQATNLATMLISSPIDQSGRVAYATALMGYLDIHSYGKVLHNRELDHDQGRASKIDLIAGYKFTLAFENSISVDYVTEKFFDPLIAGSVPVYLGAPNIEQFAPGDHCFINTADFPEPRQLAAYLLALHQDDAAYQAYFEWKQRPFHPAFSALLAQQATHPYVRLCSTVQARQGVGRT